MKPSLLPCLQPSKLRMLALCGTWQLTHVLPCCAADMLDAHSDGRLSLGEVMEVLAGCGDLVEALEPQVGSFYFILF